MDDRIIKLIGQKTLSKIMSKKILLIGLGGVGGYALEALVRSMFLDITVIDKDIFELSNLNRQVLANTTNIGKNKVDEAFKRAKMINPSVQITPIKMSLREEDITKELVNKYDYVIDACDSVRVKTALIGLCKQEKVKLITCLGTANKTHPEALKLGKLRDTYNDPLAKKIRNHFNKDCKALNSMVVYSTELPKKQKALGTICSVPMAAGSLLVSYVINDILKEISE